MKVSCRTRHAAQQVAAISKYKWIYECYIEHRKNDKAFLSDCNNAKACLLRYKAENKAMLGSLSASH